MNIWFYWQQHQKAFSFHIPLSGIAAKRFLTQAWQVADTNHQSTALQRIGTQVMKHLNNMRQDNAVPQFEGERKSNLTTLIEILAGWTRHHPLSQDNTERMFSQSLHDILNAPQSAAISFLIAEFIQEECAVLLADRLSASETSHQLTSKPTSTQRRRSARKKAQKERRQDHELREMHGQKIKLVLKQLIQVLNNRETERTTIVTQVLERMVSLVVAEYETEATATKIEWVYRPKRRKKRGKKKKHRNTIITDTSPSSPLDSFTTDHRFPNCEYYDPNDYSRRYCIPTTTMHRPLLELMTTTDRTYTAPITFGNPSLYPASSPFYLHLSSREFLHSKREEEEEIKSNSSSMAANTGMEPNFDWYLPSLFSSQSSAHSTISSPDWDFQHWAKKNEKVIHSIQPRELITHEELNTEDSHSIDDMSVKAFSITSLDNMHSPSPVQTEAKPPDAESDSTGAVKGEGSDDGVSGYSSRSDFLYREGGFFDRQRAAKRRRRPFPFEYDEESDGVDGDSLDENLSSEQGRVSDISSSCGTRSKRTNSDTHDSSVKPSVRLNDFALLNEKIVHLENLLEERTSVCICIIILLMHCLLSCSCRNSINCQRP